MSLPDWFEGTPSPNREMSSVISSIPPLKKASQQSSRTVPRCPTALQLALFIPLSNNRDWPPSITAISTAEWSEVWFETLQINGNATSLVGEQSPAVCCCSTLVDRVQLGPCPLRCPGPLDISTTAGQSRKSVIINWTLSNAEFEGGFLLVDHTHGVSLMLWGHLWGGHCCKNDLNLILKILVCNKLTS